MKTSSVCLVKGSGSPYDLRLPVILSSGERKSARQAFCPQEIEISRSSGLPSIPTESHPNNSLTAKSSLFPVIHSHLFMADPIKFTTSNELLILSSHISIPQFAFPFVGAWFFQKSSSNSISTFHKADFSYYLEESSVKFTVRAVIFSSKFYWNEWIWSALLSNRWLMLFELFVRRIWTICLFAFTCRASSVFHLPHASDRSFFRSFFLSIFSSFSFSLFNFKLHPLSSLIL